MSVDEQTVRHLEFDSLFWGLVMVESPWPLSALEANRHGIEFCQMLVDCANLELLTDALERGYDITDIRVTLDRKLDRRPPISVEEIRVAEPHDLDELVRIARASHRITRFYADPGFPDERCHDYYEGWIRNSVGAWADQVLVAGHPARGYITIHLDGDTASIGLIAVDAAARGQGIGQRLCHGAFRWAHVAGATRMTVVTQGRNIAAQRLFQRCGFLTTSTEVWLHRWYL